jgi:hypothetical protein
MTGSQFAMFEFRKPLAGGDSLQALTSVRR